MPDFPAQDIDISRKLSLDPGTERLATKDEMIALIERGAQPERSAEKIETPRPSILANKPKSESSISAPRVAERPPAEATKKSGSGRTLNFDEKPTSSRAVPIPENIHTGAAGEIDLSTLPQFWISTASGRIWRRRRNESGSQRRESGKRGFDRREFARRAFAAREFAQHRFVDGEFEGRFADAGGFVQREFARRGIARREFDGRAIVRRGRLWLGRLGGANLYDAMLRKQSLRLTGRKQFGKRRGRRAGFIF